MCEKTLQRFAAVSEILDYLMIGLRLGLDGKLSLFSSDYNEAAAPLPLEKYN